MASSGPIRSMNPYQAPAESVSLDVQRVAFAPTSALTRATVVVLAASAVVEGLLIPRGLEHLVSALGWAGWEATPRPLWSPGEVLETILGAVAYVLIPVWFYRSYRNLRSFGVATRHSPGLAAGCFFIPIANIFLPQLIAREIWSGSSAEGSPPSEGPSPTWWAAYLAASVFGILASRRLPPIATALAEVADRGLVILSAVATIQMVREVSGRQAARGALTRAAAAPAAG